MRSKMKSWKEDFFAKHPRWKHFAPTVLGLSAVLIVYFFFRIYCYESTDDAYVEGHVTPISAKVPAHVVKVAVTDNQEVKTGDLLVLLDDSDYKVRNDIAKAELQAAEAEAEQALKDAERYRALSAQDEVSKQQFDRALLRAHTAQAKVAQARAQVEQTELALSYTQIVAPVSGHVTRKTVEQGAFAQIGQPLMAIVAEEKWIVANFKETQLTHIRPGQRVKIKIDTYPGKTFKGHIDSIQRGTGARFSLLPPENATGNFVKVVQRVPVKIVFDENPEPEYRLSLGMSSVPEIKVR